MNKQKKKRRNLPKNSPKPRVINGNEILGECPKRGKCSKVQGENMGEMHSATPQNSTPNGFFLFFFKKIWLKKRGFFVN